VTKVALGRLSNPVGRNVSAAWAGLESDNRMPTLLPFGEGCMSGEAIDTRTRPIRWDSGHGTSEG
jgi:hypothetical protein